MSDAPHPLTVLFARGTLARLTLWPALRLAVHASWGGPASTEKQRWLAGVLVDQFEPFIVRPSSTRTDLPPDEAYVEELLLQIMADEFDVALEDDSAVTVARDILKLFDAVRAGDEALILQLEAQAEVVRGKVPQYERGAGSESESDSESEWEDEDDNDENQVPQLLQPEEPQVDEDGFTLVKKGRR